MVTSIANSLGFGSGLDLPKLVADLAAASRDPKVARFDARARAVQASISAVAQARSDLESFSTSLASLVSSGALQSQPVVSDAAVLDAKPRSGARLGNFSGDIEVLQLARGQTSASAYVPAATNPIGQGTLTIAMGTRTIDVVVTSANDSLDGLASAINGANAGVMASVVTDASGARLIFKSGTGTASGFTLSSADPGLSVIATGTTEIQSARDAQFRIDGLNYSRSSNTVEDAVPGLSFTLKKLGSASIGVTRTSDTLKTTLSDFVSVYNALRNDLSTARSATRNDSALRTLDQQLSRLLTQSVSSSSPATLSAVGITTNRDGSISLDEAKFSATFATNPDGVEALFMPSGTDLGIGGALAAIKTEAVAATGSITGLSARLGKESAAIAKDRESMEAREAVYKARLEKQFGGLDGRLGALKATQSYLKQQIDVWSKGN